MWRNVNPAKIQKKNKRKKGKKINTKESSLFSYLSAFYFLCLEFWNWNWKTAMKMNLNLRLIFVKTLLCGLVIGQQQQQQQTSGSGSSGSRDLFKCRQMCYQKVSTLHSIHRGKCISLVVSLSSSLSSCCVCYGFLISFGNRCGNDHNSLLFLCWKLGNSIIYVYFLNLLALLQKWKRWFLVHLKFSLIRSFSYNKTATWLLLELE